MDNLHQPFEPLNPQMEERHLCCLIHIALDHIAYSAFRQRPKDMGRHAKQLLAFIINERRGGLQ
jgi:hypothetical protein